MKEEKDVSEEIMEEEEKTSLDIQVQNWIERAGNSESTMYIYKVTKPGLRELCNKYTGDDIPDEHTIGLTFGSGKYVAVMYTKGKKTGTSFSFCIGTAYDVHKATIQNSNHQQPIIMQQSDNGGQFKEGMLMMIEMFKTLMPVQQPQQSMFPDMRGIMMNQYKDMSELMKHNLIETSALANQLVKQKQEVHHSNEEEEEESETPMNPLLAMLPELLKYLPALMASPAAPAINHIANNPEIVSAGVKAIQEARVIQPKKPTVQNKKPVKEVINAETI